jgi:hypothetical protein
MRIEGSNRRLSLHWTSLAEGNANFSIVIVFRYADDLMVGFEHREEAERPQGINYFPAQNSLRRWNGKSAGLGAAREWRWGRDSVEYWTAVRVGGEIRNGTGGWRKDEVVDESAR